VYIVQWPCPLIDRLSGLLRKIELFMGCSVGFKYAKNALVAGALLRTPLGELTTLHTAPILIKFAQDVAKVLPSV